MRKRRRSEKERRRYAALLYTATLIWHDDGEIAAEFSDELQNLAWRLLDRAKWPHEDLPTVEQIQHALNDP